jgi:hypothetical protein
MTWWSTWARARIEIILGIHCSTAAAAAQFSRAKFQQQNWAGSCASQRRKSLSRQLNSAGPNSATELGRQTCLATSQKPPPVLIPWAMKAKPTDGRAMLGCSVRNASAKCPNMSPLVKTPPPLGNYSLLDPPTPLPDKPARSAPPLTRSPRPASASTHAKRHALLLPLHAFRFSP